MKQHAIHPWGTLVLRASLGVLFLAHGLTKVFVFTPGGTAAFFASVGFPGFLAYPVMLAEVLGGLALLAGFLTRWAALGMVPVMIGASTVHLENGWVFNNAGGGWEFPVFLAAASLALFLIGDDGALSVARVLRPRAGISVRTSGGPA